MDVQVQSLIDKIKKDGVSAAETQAKGIIASAEKKAQNIIAEAEEKAAGIVKTAKAETGRMEKSSVDAVKQVGRNLLLAFRDSMNTQLAAIVNAETAKAYSPELLKTLIPETVKVWASKSDAGDIAVLLAPKDLAALEGGFRAALKAELSKGLELESDNTLAGGFRIGTRDGAAYYDFSAESVAALFAAYLNPRVASIMKDAATSL
jgi:V/A-type H+-transporting ATPase subunit E